MFIGHLKLQHKNLNNHPPRFLAPCCRGPRPDEPRLAGKIGLCLLGAALFEWGFEGWDGTAGTLTGALGGGGFMDEDGGLITGCMILGITAGGDAGIWEISSEEARVRFEDVDVFDDCPRRCLAPCLMFLLIRFIAAWLRLRFSWSSSCRWFSNALISLLFKLFGPGFAMIWLYWFSNAGSLGGGICDAISSSSFCCKALPTIESDECRLTSVELFELFGDWECLGSDVDVSGDCAPRLRLLAAFAVFNRARQGMQQRSGWKVVCN